MRDIQLNTLRKKIQYPIAWLTFIICGTIVVWSIALWLAVYGKTTANDVENIKNVLNKSYQKFIYVYGSIVFCLIAFLILLFSLGGN